MYPSIRMSVAGNRCHSVFDHLAECSFDKNRLYKPCLSEGVCLLFPRRIGFRMGNVWCFPELTLSKLTKGDACSTRSVAQSLRN